MKYKLNKKLIITAFVFSMILSTNTKVFAQYGGGAGGYDSESLEITKEVKLEGDENFRDKVYVDFKNASEKDKNIIFRITVKNNGDSIDKLKYEDFLPNSLDKVSGDLTEEVGSLNNNESRSYEIVASIDEDDKNRDYVFEKCVVNKVELRQDDDYKDNDVATVCYGNVDEPTQLPETGFIPLTGLSGLGLVTLSSYLKKKIKK